MADHPNTPVDVGSGMDTLPHLACGGKGCAVDGGSGKVPDWFYEIDK